MIRRDLWRRCFEWAPAVLVAIWLIVWIVATGGCANAQTVHITNSSLGTFDGWARCTVDHEPPHAVGTVSGATYVLGRRVGSVRVVDVHARVAAGQTLALDLARAVPATHHLGAIPADIGWPAIAGVPLVPAAGQWLAVDGAAYSVHLHARVGPMLHVDLWARYYPGQGWAPAEVVVCASNGSVPDMVGTIPADFRLTCGDAVVVVPGLPWGAPLLPAGETIADGQARSFPVTFGWRRRLLTTTEQQSAVAAADLRIAAVGLSRVHPLGNVDAGAGFDVRAWIAQNAPGSVSRLHGWNAGPLGVAATSGQTGAQEDQGFAKGGEAMLPGGVPAATIRYLVALGQSRRPCHHLEADGQPLDLGAHPRLVMWSSRPHWHTGVSPDQLGKPRQLTTTETRGWSGPDREHWLVNTLAAAARLTGSPALQWQLQHHGRTFIFQETVKAGLSTSSSDASRSAGWAGMVVAHLWDVLEDRGLAEAVAARWRDRVLMVYVPRWGSQPGGIWDHREDARLTGDLTGYERAWMPYQQAVGAYGMWLASSMVGPPEGVDLAVRGARAVVEHGYTQANGAWIEWDVLGYAGGERLPEAEYVEGRGGHRTGWFRAAWFPMGVYVAARDGDAKAIAIWQQVRGAVLAGKDLMHWFPPEAR